MRLIHTLLATTVLLTTLALSGCSKKDDVAATPACLFESLNKTATGESQKATYDSQRRLMKITDRSLDSSGKSFSTTELAFTYNADGKPAGSTTTKDGQAVSRRVYLYTNGVFSGIDTYEAGATTPTYGNRYTLNAAGNVIMTKGIKTADDPEGDQFMIEWVYDTRQNLTKATYTFGADVVVLDMPDDYDTNPVSYYSAKDYALSPYDGASLSVNNPRKEQVSFLDDKTGKLELQVDIVNALTYDAKGYATAVTQTENISKTKSAYTLTYFGCN